MQKAKVERGKGFEQTWARQKPHLQSFFQELHEAASEMRVKTGRKHGCSSRHAYHAPRVFICVRLTHAHHW